MATHSPSWANAEHTAINLVFDHPVYGEIPFSASPSDPEQNGRDLYSAAISGDFGQIAEYVAPLVPIAQVRSEALSAIDIAAGVARAKYITVSPGQAETYILKAQQAAAYKASGYSGNVPVLVQVEADVMGQTGQDAAESILAQQAAWEAVGAEIERARRAGKIAVGAATDAAAAVAARDAAIAALQAL